MRHTALLGVAFCLTLFAVTSGAVAQDATQPAAAEPAAAQPNAAPAAKPKAAKPAEWTGTWSGSVAQVGRAKPFAFELTLSGKTGKTGYPDDHCTGKLVRAGASGNYAFFVETITEGKLDSATNKGCLDGSLTIMKDVNGLVIGWMATHDGKAVVAYGTLVPRN